MSSRKQDKMRNDSIKAGINERRKINKELLELTGIEKEKYEIGMLKGRIRNCNDDLTLHGDNHIIRSKIKFMEDELKRRQENLRKMEEENNESAGPITVPKDCNDGCNQTELSEFEEDKE